MSLLILLNFKHFVAHGSGTAGVGEGGFDAEAYRKAVEARAHTPAEKSRLETVRELSKPEEVAKEEAPKPPRRKKKQYVEPEVSFRKKPGRLAASPELPQPEISKPFSGYKIPKASEADLQRLREEERQKRLAREERRIELEQKLLAAQMAEIERIRIEKEFARIMADDEEAIILAAPIIVKKLKGKRK